MNDRHGCRDEVPTLRPRRLLVLPASKEVIPTLGCAPPGERRRSDGEDGVATDGGGRCSYRSRAGHTLESSKHGVARWKFRYASDMLGRSLVPTCVLIVEDEPYMAEAIRDGYAWRLSPPISPETATRPRAVAGQRQIAVLDHPVYQVAKRIVASGSGMPILLRPPLTDSTTRLSGSSRRRRTTSPSPSNSGSSRVTA